MIKIKMTSFVSNQWLGDCKFVSANTPRDIITHYHIDVYKMESTFNEFLWGKISCWEVVTIFEGS